MVEAITHPLTGQISPNETVQQTVLNCKYKNWLALTCINQCNGVTKLKTKLICCDKSW